MPEKKSNPFFIRDFMGVDAEIVDRLASAGIKHTQHLLAAGRTPELRAELASRTNLPGETILELVKLSDLVRLPGVKGIRARLYYDAGVDCVEKLAAWEPEALRLMVGEYVARTGFPGIPPLPKEVSSTIANAQRLPKLVEW